MKEHTGQTTHSYPVRCHRCDTLVYTLFDCDWCKEEFCYYCCANVALTTDPVDVTWCDICTGDSL